MFELFLHIETITFSGLSLNINDKYFLNKIAYPFINNLFQYIFVIREVTYEAN